MNERVRGARAVSVTIGLFGAIWALPALALPDKCQSELAKRSAMFHAKVANALQKCGDAIRREQAKNLVKAGSGFLVTAAHLCQKELNRIFDFPNVLGGKSERQKFFDAVDKALTSGTTPKCSVSDLEWQGLMHSGTGGLGFAPPAGVNPWDFAKVWLAVMQVQRALDGQLAVQADFLSRLQEVIAAAPKPPGTSVSTAATNCTLPVSCDPRTTLGCRPDLCRFRPPCFRQGCALGGSSNAQFAQPGVSESYTAQGLLPLTVCSLAGWGYPFGGLGEGVLVGGSPSRTLVPVPIPNTSGLGIGGSTACVDVIRTMGYCACAPPFTGAATDFDVCRDHVEGSGVACSGSAVTGSSAADSAHSGTTNSATFVQPTGAGVSNDCVVWATLRLTVVASGNEGPDGAACTSDDFNPTTVMVATPLTTGAAGGSIQDAVVTPGTCSGSSTSCVEDANCPSGQTCTSPSPSFGTLSSGPFTGSPVSGACANIVANQLSGISLVGVLPVVDLPNTTASGVTDTIVGLTLTCP